jgi:hypothetical protein
MGTAATISWLSSADVAIATVTADYSERWTTRSPGFSSLRSVKPDNPKSMKK